MNKKCLVTFGIVAIYATLIGLFFKFYKESSECSEFSSSCIRFCSEDVENYSNEFLFEEFRKSKSGRDLKEISNIYRGLPICGGVSFLPPFYNETSSRRPYYIQNNGVLDIEFGKYDQLRYCLEKSDDVYDGWKIFACDQDVKIRTIYHLTLISISIILYGFVLFMYCNSEELKDFHGKWTISFTSFQFATLILFSYCTLTEFKINYNHPILGYLFDSFILSMMFGILWITVMIFHEYFTFKNFKHQKTIPYNLTKYAVITTILIIISIFLSSEIASMMYTFIGILAIATWIVTGFKIYALSRNPTYSQQARFNFEKKWFWNCMKLSLTLVIAWLIQFLALRKNYNLLLFMIADSILFLTTITITMIALERKKIFGSNCEKYTGIINTNVEELGKKVDSENVKV